MNEYTILRKDGSFFHVLANSNVIEDGNGSFSGLRIVAMDLTEKNKIEKKLIEEEQKYKLLAENVNDIIFVQDMNLNIKYASPSANKIFGYKNYDINRIKMKDIMTEDSLKKAISSFKKYVRLVKKDLNINIPLMEYKYIRKDKSTFWGELKVGFLRDSKGNLTGSIGILRDIILRGKKQNKN